MKIRFNNWILLVLIISNYLFFFGCEFNSFYNQLPICVIIYPEDKDTLNIDNSFVVFIHAYDTDGTIESVKVLIDEVEYQHFDTLPVRVEISIDDIKNDSCKIKAIAIDNEEGVGEDSVTVWFKVIDSEENQLPVCIITNPNDGDTLDVNGSFMLTVDAYDTDGFIESVLIFINETGYQFTDDFPVQFEINIDDIEMDSCRIKAIAIDNQNGIAEDVATIWFKKPTPINGLPTKDISGIIAQNKVLSNDTIWHVVGNCLVENGVQLIIEPGTLISFAPNHIDYYSGYCIDIKGKLIAKGTLDNKITFRPDNLDNGAWGGIIFYGESDDWDISSNTGSVVEFCKFYNGGISQSTGSIGAIATEDAFPLINNNSFYNSKNFDLCARSNGSTKNSLIYNNYFTGYVYITSNFFFKGNIKEGKGYLAILDSPKAIIEENTFKNSNTAISLHDDISNIKIINNNFSNNNNCVWLRTVYNAGIIKQNNFENSQFAITLENTSIDIDASFNYWGTADSILIGNYIYDFYDDYKLGKVNYSNFSPIRY